MIKNTIHWNCSWKRFPFTFLSSIFPVIQRTTKIGKVPNHRVSIYSHILPIQYIWMKKWNSNLKYWNPGSFLTWLDTKKFLQHVRSTVTLRLDEVNNTYSSSLLMLFKDKKNIKLFDCVHSSTHINTSKIINLHHFLMSWISPYETWPKEGPICITSLLCAVLYIVQCN